MVGGGGGGGELALFDQLGERVGELRERGLNRRGLGVEHHHRRAGLGEELHDAAPHGAGADHADPLENRTQLGVSDPLLLVKGL